MKDNKKKKDRRKYPQGSAASHAGQNSGNHGGHAGHPRSRSSKLLKNRKTLLMDLVSSKNYEPMRLKDIAMLLQVPKAKRSELAEVMEILVKEGKIDVISDGRYQKSRGASTTTEKREKETAAPESRAEEDAMTDSTERMERTATQRRSRVSRLSISRQSWTLTRSRRSSRTRDHTGRKMPGGSNSKRLQRPPRSEKLADGDNRRRGCQRPR